MIEKMILTPRIGWKKEILKAKEQKNSVFFNFMNSHDLYFFVKNSLFREAIRVNNINFVDGFVISVFLSLKNFKNVKRFSGTDFTIDFLNEKNLSRGKHLFIGLEKSDIKILIEKFPWLNKKNLFSYNPPYIKDMRFEEKEINKIAKIVNSKKINFIWIGLGCPKQYILSYDLSKKIKKGIFFNVGAALNFVVGKKKRAPKIVRSLGMEWLYRLLTNFQHTKIKVLRSFVSLLYLNKIRLKNNYRSI